MFVVFDLDGTIADTSHRSKYLDGTMGKKDWRGFYAACVNDAAHTHVLRVLFALESSGCRVEIWSGRSKEVEAETIQWLADHGLGHIPIKMREDGDYTPDDVLKRDWLLQTTPRPDLIFDDRKKVVDMWRAEGVPCFQVAPGDF